MTVLDIGYSCEACDAPLDENISLCDLCFAVMPMDRMVSPDQLREMRVRLDRWATDSGYTRLEDGDYQYDETGDIWMSHDLYEFMLEVLSMARRGVKA